MPVDPACGHSCCGARCNVRYVGAVSFPRDHHVLHAARGVANIWTAVVITGLATVLTGAIAFTSVQAKMESQSLSRGEYMAMMQRVSQMEKALQDMQTICGGRAPGDNATDASSTASGQLKSAPTRNK